MNNTWDQDRELFLNFNNFERYIFLITHISCGYTHINQLGLSIVNINLQVIWL